MRKFLFFTVCCLAFQQAIASAQQAELYELRVYLNNTPEKQSLVNDYLKSSLVPALHRTGIKQVGVFKPVELDNYSMFMLVPFKNAQDFVSFAKQIGKR